MKKTIIFVVLALLVITAVQFLFSGKETPTDPKPPTNNLGNLLRTSPTASITPDPNGPPVIKLFLIAVDDNGKNGEKIGCNDSVVPVDKEISSTTVLLTSALNELLAIKEKDYQKTGYYSALYQSDLKLDGVTVKNGLATIKLSGTLRLGGECDNPRVKAQLTQTALQFDTVDRVETLINGRPIKEMLTGK